VCVWQVDARMRGGLRMLRWQNSVLIFDEAHNVEVRGRTHPAPLAKMLQASCAVCLVLMNFFASS